MLGNTVNIKTILLAAAVIAVSRPNKSEWHHYRIVANAKSLKSIEIN